MFGEVVQHIAASAVVEDGKRVPKPKCARFIATAALLVARRIAPDIMHYCVFSHQSDEQGHTRVLQQLGEKPLLNLNMRLGEGTGAALAVPLVRAAITFLNDMASFESAGVSDRNES